MGDNVRKNIMLLTVLVCIAGMITGALFGLVMDGMGTIWGAIGGLAAGLIWTKSMAKRLAHGITLGECMLAGTGRGVLVGLLATAILHGGFYIMQPKSLGAGDSHGLLTIIIIVAVICAVAGGSVTGFLCSLLAHCLTRPSAAEKPPTHSDANS